MMFTTAEIATESRTSLRGVRIWETAGLFGRVERDEHGNRVFTEDHKRRAKIIVAGQMAGMSLAELKTLFADFSFTARTEVAEKIFQASSFMNETALDLCKDFDL